MKKLGLLLVLVLAGCFADREETDTKVSKNSAPTAITLSNEVGAPVGRAIPFRDNVFVAPDHLWQNHQPLYYSNSPIEVLVRDFQHDVLFFSIPSEFYFSVIWQPVPPGVGQDLAWFDGAQIHDVQVISANESFFNLDEITSLMSINDVLEPGDSGSPLFSEEGEIFGMLIGTDLEAQKAYFVRSDIILDIAAEYLQPTEWNIASDSGHSEAGPGWPHISRLFLSIFTAVKQWRSADSKLKQTL